MAEKWIGTTEAARITGYNAHHIRRLIWAGRVKARKFGPLWQVDRVSLLAYVHSAEQAGRKRGPKRDT